MNITEMTALELGKKIKNGEVRVAEAVQSFLDAIEKTDGSINAYITVTRDEALARAEEVQKQIDAGELDSPLAGVPVAIKDNISTRGIKTSCASKILGDFKPPYNATVIDKLNKAGAVVIGKLNMDEFAMGSTTETSYYGPTKNPWNTDRVPGGSSGGAAAAVAALEAPYALGSDTGGSIRQPASFCGVTGMKPTYGAVSRYGLIAYASSLDQIGPVAKDAADCAAILDVICGKDEMDGTSLDVEHKNYLDSLTGDVSGLKIGIPKQCFGDGLNNDVKSAVLSVAETLKQKGAVVEEFDMDIIEYVVPTYYIIAAAEASSNLSRFDGVKYGFRAEEFEDLTDLYKATRSEGFGEEVKRRILLGTFALSTGYYDAYYKKALQVKALIKKAFDEAYAKFDVILFPAAPTTAPKLGESLSDPLKMYLSDIYTVSVNLAGLPGISVPCGFDSDGMPVGAQLVGAPLGDDVILNAAYTYQTLTDFHKKSPANIGKERD
ncbi:MAG: Asp-tRNA(Asn)/Glu-tRNA(Gln) amidotransferase subunit GatA [Clostridiales bacterium]|nr:Asp-tRNA(Asn)/Glu-tRNA(Gln) amidotransferase subunit GatA [Clostridiales bacterium]